VIRTLFRRSCVGRSFLNASRPGFMDSSIQFERFSTSSDHLAQELKDNESPERLRRIMQISPTLLQENNAKFNNNTTGMETGRFDPIHTRESLYDCDANSRFQPQRVFQRIPPSKQTINPILPPALSPNPNTQNRSPPQFRNPQPSPYDLVHAPIAPALLNRHLDCLAMRTPPRPSALAILVPSRAISTTRPHCSRYTTKPT
jgi:hypothetical protein